MASKSNNVLIHLKAIGADQTARDINKVSKALTELRGKAAESDQAQAKRNDNLIQQMRRQEDMLKRLRKAQVDYDKSVRSSNTALEKQAAKSRAATATQAEKAEQALWKKRQIIHKAYMGYLRDERIAKERSIRDEEKRLRAEDRIYKQHANKRKKLREELTVLPAFRRPFRVAMIASITTLVADAISFVGTGLNALAAGAIAGVNGLAPLTGMLITIPAMFTTIAQSILPATWGVKNFVAAWKGDKDSLKGAGKNTLALSKALKKLKPDFKDLRKDVGERFIKGFDQSFGKLANVYLPILRKRLTGTAAAFNAVLTSGMKWFSSARGQSVVDTIMGTNNAIIRGGGGGVLNLLKGMGGLLKAASPMLRQASGEFQSWTNNLQQKIFANQKGLGKFFRTSYKTFKGVTGTLGDFGTGLYRIFKKSAPLSRWMGRGIKEAGENFMIWANSPGGTQSINRFFHDMKPNLKSIGKLAGSLGKTLFDIAQSPNFAKNVNEISDKLLPALGDIIKASDGKFIPNLVKFAETLASMAEGGLIDALAETGGLLVDIFGKMAGVFNSLSPETQKWLVMGVALVGLFGGIATGIAGVIVKLLQFLALLGKTRTAGKIGGFLFGGGGGGALRGGGKGGGKGGGGGGFIGGAGGSGKGSKGGRGGVVTGGGKGSKKGKPTGRKPPKGSYSAATGKYDAGMKKGKGGGRGAMGGGIAAGAAGALFFAGPVADAASGAGKAMADMEFRSQGAFQSISKGGKDADASLNGLFNDIRNPHWNSFGESLEKTANPTKWQKFRQNVQGVTGALTGATTPLEQAQAKFEGMDSALTHMPAAQAAQNFSKIRNEANQMGIPMDKLVSLFPQYRDSLAGTLSAGDKAAGGMNNATVAANKMSGVVTKAAGSLKDVDTLKVAPKKLTATDEVTPKASTAVQKLAAVGRTKAHAGMTASDGITPKVSTAKGALTGINGKTSNTHINTSNQAPGAVSAAASALNGLNGKTATTYIKTVRSVSEVRLGGASGGRGSGPGRWMGGMTYAGSNYTVGERGTEIGIDRSGRMMMLGAGGQHGFSPSRDMAIIPHGATTDPFGGNYGNAPEWAKRSLQGAVAAKQAGIMSSRGSVYAPNVKVEVTNPGQNVDVKRAVMSAMREMEREREARR